VARAAFEYGRFWAAMIPTAMATRRREPRGRMAAEGLLDAAERLELTEHLKTAAISLGDRARLRRMTALTRRAHDGDPTESPEMW
jgi:hypothetical protein